MLTVCRLTEEAITKHKTFLEALLVAAYRDTPTLRQASVSAWAFYLHSCIKSSVEVLNSPTVYVRLGSGWSIAFLIYVQIVS